MFLSPPTAPFHQTSCCSGISEATQKPFSQWPWERAGVQFLSPLPIPWVSSWPCFFSQLSFHHGASSEFFRAHTYSQSKIQSKGSDRRLTGHVEQDDGLCWALKCFIRATWLGHCTVLEPCCSEWLCIVVMNNGHHSECNQAAVLLLQPVKLAQEQDWRVPQTRQSIQSSSSPKLAPLALQILQNILERFTLVS